MFSLRDLSDLPTLRDLRELRMDDNRDGLGQTEDDALDLDDEYDEGVELVDDDDWEDEDDLLEAAPLPPSIPRLASPRVLPPDPGAWDEEEAETETDAPPGDGTPTDATDASLTADNGEPQPALGTLLSWRRETDSTDDPTDD
jgi:hypothetical protein